MNKTLLKDILIAFKKYLDQPKTLWDIKDYSFAFITIIGSLLFITYVAVVFNQTN